MDVNDIVNALNGVLDLCDSLDNSGAGIQAVSSSGHTTRELCKMELGQFLLYVADGSILPTDGQASVINLVLGDMYSNISQFQIKQIAKDVGIPDASSNATLTVFMMADAALAQQNGAQSASLTDLLINVYEAFGRLVVVLDENSISEGRCDRYLSALKAKASSGGTGSSKPEPTPKATPAPKTSTAKTTSSSTAKAKSTPSSKSSATTKKTTSSTTKSTAAKKTESSTDKKTTSTSTAKKTTSATSKKTESTSTKKTESASEKKSSTSIAKQMQILWENYQAERGTDAVSEDEILKALNKTNYKGIHDITDHSTWISPNGIWAMRIPAGFSYTMDYTETASAHLLVNFNANVQITGNVDFKKSKADPFNMGIAPLLGLVNSDDALQDLMSNKAAEAIVNYKDGLPGNVSVLKLTSDVVVLFQSWEDTLDRKKIQKVLFFVICSGCTAVTGGEMAMLKSAGDSLTSMANAMLESITKVPQKPQKNTFIPSVIPKEFKLSFDKGTVIRTSEGMIIPVPDGFKGSISENEIGQRAFSIVPEGLKFWDGTGDQSYLPLDISLMKVGSNALPTSVDISGKVLHMVSQQLEQQGAFDTHLPFYLARLTDKGSYFFQQFTDFADTSWTMIRVLQISDAGAKIYTIRMNFGKKIPLGYYYFMLYEARMLAMTWIDQISVNGEVLYHHGHFSVKPVNGLEEDSHEHLDIINSGKYTTRRSADFRAQAIRSLMEREGNTSAKAYSMMTIPDDDYQLDKEALRFAEVFRMTADQFDAWNDTEALIRLGMFENVRSYHGLRSLAWTVGALAEKGNKKFSQFSFNDLKAIGENIESGGWLNYTNESYFPALCDQYDWHVFYVPDKYLTSSEANSTDLRMLCGKENRGGNTISIAAFGLGIDTFSDTNRINELIGRNEETLASLEDLRKDLTDLLPVMKTTYDGFMKSRDRTKKLEGPLAEALMAWCALSIAASEPFYTEEAADTPEANAALHAPLKRPDGSVADSNGDDYKALYEYGKAETVSRFGNYIPNEEPERSYRDYRQDMEAACKAGKPLQEMIDAGRKAVESSFMGDKDAFDQAVKNLDRDANIIFSGKHFVLTGFGEYEDGVIAEIEERGGVVHSHMVKMADYLVVCLESPGASKVKEALNWRKKGASNQIVSDYQMWQAMLGKASSGSGTQKKTTAAQKTASSSTSRSSTVTQNKTASTSASKAPSSTSSSTKTASDQMAGLEKTVSSTASELANAARTATTAEEKKAIQEAQSILENMQSEMSSTSSALEKHAEHLRKQEEEKEKRMAEARAKGKSSKDETDMLAVLLIEEDQGNLNRPDDDFATTFAEDFAAYTPQQLISLRAKVRPKMHDSSFVEVAKQDMLSRPVKDRFGISTANWFNLSNLWDFNDKGAKAIEKTKQYYRDSEMYELRNLMSDHKQAGIDSVNSQLSGFNSAWDSFGGVRNDLHICIGKCDEPIPDSRKVFDVMIDGINHVYIQLQHPSMGYLTIPIMNLFASVWKTTPDKVWDAALNNSINDSRSVSSVTSRADAMKAKNKALAAIGMKTPEVKKPSTPSPAPTPTSRPTTPNTSKYNASVSNSNSKRIKEIEESIASLRREHDSIRGIFGFMKKNKIKKEISELEQELNTLRRG